jgi:beta-lactamase regulating signal transducer with metallopeptidase domain
MIAMQSFANALIEFALGNLVFALPVGLLAWWLQARGDRPFLAHLLWLLVLIKLVTPPLLSLPVAIVPAAVPTALMSVDSPPLDSSLFGAPDTAQVPSWLATISWQLVLVGTWLAGSAIVLAGSLLRAARFNRLLWRTSKPADRVTQAVASGIASRLGLANVPEVRTTIANLSPMVWWIGGRVRIYLPQTMAIRMDRDELGSILAHELGHVRRRDHIVRWLEWAVCVLNWWNPVAWWARRNLRVSEEICCDAFVLSRTAASRDAYAGALVSALELLVVPAVRPSGLASHVNGGTIERRIRMILSGQSLIETPRWLRGAVLVAAALVLPLGFSLAQDAGNLDRVEEWLESGVNSAFLTEQQAAIMLNALRGAERQLEIDTIDDRGNIMVIKRQVIGDGTEILVDVQGADFQGVDIQGVEAGNILAVAERSFAEQVASGRISQAEADVILAELTNDEILGSASEVVGTIRVFSVEGEPVEVTIRGPEATVEESTFEDSIVTE